MSERYKLPSVEHVEHDEHDELDEHGNSASSKTFSIIKPIVFYNKEGFLIFKKKYLKYKKKYLNLKINNLL
jgi:hypothetical protein